MTRNVLKSVFEASILAVKPENALATLVRCEANNLVISEVSTALHSASPNQKSFDFQMNDIFLLAFGKAAIPMTCTFLQSSNTLLRNRIKLLRVIHPGESRDATLFQKFFQQTLPDVKIFSAAQNNLPNEASITASAEILDSLSSTSQWRNPVMLISLISGGGSALLCHPRDGISLQYKLQVIQQLTSQGATIQEVNVIRGVLSKVKAGKLLNWLPHDARVINLIMSDIVGDPIHLIASGPTVFPPSAEKLVDAEMDTFQQIIAKYKLLLNESVLSNGLSPVPNVDVHNVLAVNNMTAIRECMVHAKLTSSFDSCLCLTSIFEGPVETLVSKTMQIVTDVIEKSSSASTSRITLKNPFSTSQHPDKVSLTINLSENSQNTSILFVIGGESTVTLSGHGKGGRNQHAALLALGTFIEKLDLYRKHNVVFLSGGTDGQDGPTDATGAVVDCQLAGTVLQQKLDLKRYIDNCDSYAFFDHLEELEPGIHLKPGKTGTNVMDLVLVSVTV